MARVDRIMCSFSCGAASAVATKLAIKENAGRVPLVIMYTEVAEEHPDNRRFLRECEEWFGQKVEVVRNEKYGASIYEVFSALHYLAGPAGAPCTRLLKKEPSAKFRLPFDRLVLGYTAEEQDRVDRFLDANAEIDLWTPLIDAGVTKANCLGALQGAGIELPAMYKLGYHNNNCIGCVKAGKGYWNKIRVDFPATFERMAHLEQQLGAALFKEKRKGEPRGTLRTLDPTEGRNVKEPTIDCGIFCEMPEFQTSFKQEIK